MFRHPRQLRAADVQLYRLCDAAAGGLILLMVVFSPWAFGTTEIWSTWIMNAAAGLLAVPLLIKFFIRKIKKYPAPRWDALITADKTYLPRPAVRAATTALAWLTLALLLFCLVSAWNGAATYDKGKHFFIYHSHLDWLPHSFDSARSWFYFWTYLGLAVTFWSVRDWLLGRTAEEEKNLHRQNPSAATALPARLRRLLWLLTISGTALAIESIVQRAVGSSKLLFLVQPVVNPEGDTQFGPFAYRANAAQYFNLLWPLCLGAWWRLRRDGSRKNIFLPVAAAVMAACPIISISRGGALVAAGLLVATAILFVGTEIIHFARFGATRRRWLNLILTVLVIATAIGLGWWFGWEKLSPRMEQIGDGFSNREQMYVDARPMARDYPLFGTGPGTFGTVFQLYRISNATYWPEQLHNDWLETLITFGWTGLLLALAALGCVAVAGWFAPRRFAVMAGLALAGCLVHARFDFPFQIHSIVLLFLLIAAMLLALGAKARSQRGE
jgi:hypothetical protein